MKKIDKDTWDLDYSLALWLTPRLKRFIEVNDGVPHPFKTMKAWNKVLNEMLVGFEEAIKQHESGTGDETKIMKGYKLLAKYHYALWW